MAMARDVRSRQMTRLPNGLVVDSLSREDTLMVYRDIFDDDCYRRSGVTIRDGDCILDVGANTGLFMLFLNQIVSHARLYSLEPVPSTFRVLSRNVEAHNRLTIQLFNLGLSDRSGPAVFTHYPRLSNASTLFPDESEEAAERGRDYLRGQIGTLSRPLPALLAMCPAILRDAIVERVRKYYLKKQEVTCELTTLSEFLAEHAIDRVDLLKVDAEQSEQRILAGLGEGDWGRIRQVIVEVHGGEVATRKLGALLRRHGFRTAAEPNPTFPSLSLVYGTKQDPLDRVEPIPA
jgi:FkbM family methyltransferase